jgi:phosphate-selective porin
MNLATSENLKAVFIYLLHRFDKHHQLGVKYDWYDPNSNISNKEIGVSGSKTGAADIQYNTIGFGYISYINDNLKLVLWYDIVKNESTLVSGYESDKKDNVLTCRLQFRF